MDNNFPDVGRYITILDRLMKMCYDRGLADFEIGWGQQFYVEYISDHPGATAQEMVKCIRVDKATLTKIIKKLVEVGYVEAVGDERDRRVKHLYLTEKGRPAVTRIKEIHRIFYDILCQDISPEDIQRCEDTLERMMENINRRVQHRMEGGREHVFTAD